MSMNMSSGEMCSFFYQSTEAASTVQGDLTDIVRGGGRSSAVPSGFLASTGIDPRDSDQLLELSAKGCLSSPRPIMPAPAVPVVPAPRAPGVKRRKGQAKRVICIPAPAISSADHEGSNKSSSTSGVVVPSDLWAWRKYGQKPIKGSPYPRGYYRCSSSKSCSARKQVERSRSDPNMLVITYTSEHNHPWPTHRNSLAGSTRSSSSSSSHPSKNQKNSNQPSPSSSKQEADHDLSMLASPNTEAMIKEEILDFDRVFDQSYAPMMLHESKDMELFDELGLDPDPMSFFFSSRELKLEEDPLSYFDNWDGN